MLHWPRVLIRFSSMRLQLHNLWVNPKARLMAMEPGRGDRRRLSLVVTGMLCEL